MGQDASPLCFISPSFMRQPVFCPPTVLNPAVSPKGNPIIAVEKMVDSLGPSVSVAYYDELAIQIKTNLLQLDEEMYTFMFNR